MTEVEKAPEHLTNPASGWWRVQSTRELGGEEYLMLVLGKRIASTNMTIAHLVIGEEAGETFSEWYKRGWTIEFEGGAS